MSELITKAKLVRAYQHLRDSSESYDAGCMEIKELLDLMPDSELHKKPDNQALMQNVIKELLETIDQHNDHGLVSVQVVKDKIEAIKRGFNALTGDE